MAFSRFRSPIAAGPRTPCSIRLSAPAAVSPSPVRRRGQAAAGDGRPYSSVASTTSSGAWASNGCWASSNMRCVRYSADCLDRLASRLAATLPRSWMPTTLFSRTKASRSPSIFAILSAKIAGLLGKIDHGVLGTAASLLRLVFHVGIRNGIGVIRKKPAPTRHADGQDGGLPDGIHRQFPELLAEFLGREPSFLPGPLDHLAAQDDVALGLGIVAQDHLHVPLLQIGRNADGAGQLDLGGRLVLRHLPRHHHQHDDDGGHEAQQEQPKPLGDHVEILADVQPLGARELAPPVPPPAGGGRHRFRPLDHVAHVKAPAIPSPAQSPHRRPAGARLPRTTPLQDPAHVHHHGFLAAIRRRPLDLDLARLANWVMPP
jgi:hypothetical protein